MTKNELQSVLESKIIGQTKPAWQCCCGTIKQPASVAIRIVQPEAKEFFYLWYFWGVQMRDISNPDGDYNYSCGLDDFIAVDDIKKLFTEVESLDVKP